VNETQFACQRFVQPEGHSGFTGCYLSNK
jgi:hypothetical protein